MTEQNDTEDLMGLDVSDMSDDQLEQLSSMDTDTVPEQDTDTEEETDNTDTESDNDTEEDTEEPEGSVEDQVKSLKEQVTKLEKIKNDRQVFFNKQNQIIRFLKDKLDSLQEAKDKLNSVDAKDQVYEDPEAMVNNQLEKRQLKESEDSIKSQLSMANEKIAMLQEFPDYLSQLQDFVDYAKENDSANTGEKEIKDFLENPFAMGINNLRNLMPKVLEYKASKSKVASNAKPVKKNKTSNKFSTSTSQNGGVNNKDVESITQSDLSSMSDSELESFIATVERG